MLSDFTVDRIKRFFESKKEPYIVYHDWSHSVGVAKRAIEIAKASPKDLTELELDILEFASLVIVIKKKTNSVELLITL